MIIEDAIKLGKETLQALPSPQFEAELLLAYALQVNRSYLMSFPERALTPDIEQSFKALLTRRASGEPFAYISGEREFYGLSFLVNEETLIPRDDTEVIVDAALDLISENYDASFSVIDLGTGSGTIALALKKMRPNISVTAVDYYATTLKIAQKNAERNHLDIQFIESNWFASVPTKAFDLIVSNPPYIDPIDQHLDGDGVKFEPKRALIAPEKGLADLFHLIETARAHFKTNGWLLLEHGYDQKSPLQEKMQEMGYQEIRTLKDYGGNDRVTMGFYPG